MRIAEAKARRESAEAGRGANRSSYHLITHNGETRYLSEWARLKGIKITTLYMRLHRYKWPVEKALCD